jgi:FkbM family methyltransferase
MVQIPIPAPSLVLYDLPDSSHMTALMNVPYGNHPGDPATTPFRTTRDGIKFLQVSTPFRQVSEVPEYWMEDIRKDDHVLDIGANIGAFCIRAAKKSCNVSAVEPVTTALLKANIARNGVLVRIFCAALGDGYPFETEWDGIRSLTPTFRMRDLIRMAGGCDFLKCDCEGAEWKIHPGDIKGIRRIEMELHQPPVGGLPNPELLRSIAREYSFSIDRIPAHGPLGQMGILHAWRPSMD